MWNKIDIKPPPTNAYEGRPNSVDVTKLTETLQKLSEEVNKCQEPINFEAALLTRIMYRIKLKFRNDPLFKTLQKMKSSLYRYLKLDLIYDIKRFLKSVLSNSHIYPTKQMFEYVLVRIQSFSKLMARIVDMSIRSVQFCLNRMKLGHFWGIALLILIISSRIGNVCQRIIDVCCQGYDEVFPIRNQLQSYGAVWLEDGYELPTTLKKWLDLKWKTDVLDLVAQKRLEMPIVIIDDDDDDVQFCFQYKKNDCIVIDDTMQVTEDDIQFVNEYIDLIAKMNQKTENTEEFVEEIEDSPILINSDDETRRNLVYLNDTDVNNDKDIGEPIERASVVIKKKKKTVKKCNIVGDENVQAKENMNYQENGNVISENNVGIDDTGEETEVDDVKLCKRNNMNLNTTIDEDIGEKVERNTEFPPSNKQKTLKNKSKRKSKQKTDTFTKNTDEERNDSIETPGSFVRFKYPNPNASTPLLTSAKLRKKRKRKTSESNSKKLKINQTEKDIQSSILQHKAKIFTITPTEKQTIIETQLNSSGVFQVSDSESESNTTLNNRKLIKKAMKQLQNQSSKQEVLRFLKTEMSNRHNNNFKSITSYLKKKKWNTMVKEVDDNFEKRKLLKMTKDEALIRAKNIIKGYLKQGLQI